MYHHIRGELILLESNHAVLERNGIGYNISITTRTFEMIQEQKLDNNGSYGEFLLYTHLHVREDQLRLFGFHTKQEK